LRDEPLSKRCVSAQRFCSVAIASKSTGSAFAAAATIQDCSGGGGGGQAGQKIGNNSFQMGQIQHLHVEFGNESQMVLL
jgi:hypothetical protein